MCDSENTIEAKKLHNLKLHETTKVGNFTGGQYKVTRVIGGWIYKSFTNEKEMLFVPYSTEFLR